MSKKVGIVLASILLGIFLLPIHQTIAATAKPVAKPTPASKDTGTTPVAPNDTGEIATIQKIIGDHTPTFISKPIIAAANYLEYFRLNYFNNPFIFYAVLAFIVIIVVRFFWRLIF